MKVWINSHSISRSSSDFDALVGIDGSVTRTRRAPRSDLDLSVTVIEHGPDEMDSLQEAWRNGDEFHLIDDATFRNLTRLAEQAMTMEADAESAPTPPGGAQFSYSMAQLNERIFRGIDRITSVRVTALSPAPVPRVSIGTVLVSGVDSTGVTMHEPTPEPVVEKPADKEPPRTRFDLLEVDIDPVCNCTARGCSRRPCKGECGCPRCHNDFQDYGYED